MRIRTWMAACVILLFTPAMLVAQTATEQQDPGSTETVPPPPAPAVLSTVMETAPVSKYINNYGFQTPPGWNLGVGLAPSYGYDSNPLFLSSPSGDSLVKVAGVSNLTYSSRHNIYQAVFNIDWSGYRKYDALDATEMSLKQTWWHESSRATTYTMRLNLERFPTWGGSAFGQSAFGSLLLALSGLNALNLRSDESVGQVEGEVRHRIGRRTALTASVYGGVAKYVPSNKIKLIQLLTAPPSSTWHQTTTLEYSFRFKPRHLIGLQGGTSYYYITMPENNVLVTSFTGFYQHEMRNGWSYRVMGGPEWVSEKLKSNSTRFMVGGSVRRLTRRSSVFASVSNDYQVGTAQGNLGVWYVNAGVERTMCRRCFIGAFTHYTQSNSPVATGDLGTGDTNTFIVAGEGGLRVTRDLVWFTNYGYCRQKGVLTGGGQVDKQMFVTGLSWTMNNLFSR